MFFLWLSKKRYCHTVPGCQSREKYIPLKTMKLGTGQLKRDPSRTHTHELHEGNDCSYHLLTCWIGTWMYSKLLINCIIFCLDCVVCHNGHGWNLTCDSLYYFQFLYLSFITFLKALVYHRKNTTSGDWVLHHL